MGSCASRQAIHSDEQAFGSLGTEQAFGSLGTWEAARRDSENGVDAIHSRSEVEHLPQPLKMKSAWPSADQQQRTSESSPGTTTIVLVASSSMSHGRVGCINCGKHRLYIAEVKLHSMGARHPKQLARLMQVLLEWDPAFAAQLESFAALLPHEVIPQESTAAGAGPVATGAPGPVMTRRQGSGLLRRPSLGTAAAEQAGRLLLVQLPPDAAAALPALASPLHAISLSMTSWQPPEPGAAPLPAILVQHTSVSALGMAAHRSGSTVQDSADSVQQEASSKAHKAQPPGALAVGLSARLLRLMSTLDALPSLVTLCTVEGQILYQNASSLQYTGSPAARATAASAQASSPGKVKTSSSFLADLLQLQPEVLEELLETVVVGADVWSQVVRVPELLAVEAPSGPAAPHRMSMCLARNSSVLSAAADASMAKAMGMLMVAPAMAAAAASITTGHRGRARPPWQTSTNGLPEASQPSMCAVARSLPSFTAKAQPQRRQALPAEPLTSQVWDKTSASYGQSPDPHPAPFVRKAPARKQVSRKASSSWLTQALSNPPPPKARSSVSSLDSPAPHDAPGAHALTSLRTQQLRGSPRVFHSPSASPAPPTTFQTLPSRHPSSQVSLGHVSLKQRSGSEDSVRASSAACSGAGTPLPVSGPRQRLLSLLSMVDREAHSRSSTGRRASSEPKDGASHPGQTAPPPAAGQPVPVRGSLLQSRSGVPAPGSQAVSVEASEPHDHSLHCFTTSDLKTTVEDEEGDKWRQTDRRLRFDAVPRQEPAPMGGGTAEERSSARQQDTEGFPTSLHEVTVTAVTDPETQQQVLLVVQTDVSERSAVEERLMALTAAQMTMLEAMFPRHIMEQIASHGATSNLTEKASGGNGCQHVATMDLSKLATHHECVTIMFTDIVGFTAFSKECTPGQVMSFLNELFSKMDGLLDKHNVYKVETAGDCYIICGGLLDEDKDGFKTVASGSPTRVAKIKAARRALNFAVEMMRVASTVMMPNTGKPVVLRAGLHSGPVVSGLVGSRLPKFSLFGDTMNTASRMESTSVPGRIQVSQATYELLRDPRPSRWQPTGGVQVKGKGLMHTYLMAEEVTRMRRTSTAGAPPDTLPTGSAALVDSAARCKSSTSLVALQQATAAAAAAMGAGGVAAVDTWDTNSWLLPPSEQLGSSVRNSSLSTLHLSCQPLDSPMSGDLSAMMASLADPTTAPYTSHVMPGVVAPSPDPPLTASSPPGQASPRKASPAANIAKPAVGPGTPAQGCSLLTLPGSTLQLDSTRRSDECSSPLCSPRPGSALTFRAPLGASSPLARSQRRITPSGQAWGPAGVGGTAEHLMASLAVRGDEHMLGMPDAPQSALTSGLDTEASCISLLGDSACNTLASHSQSSMPSMDTLVMNIAPGSLPPGAEAAPPLSSSRRMSREVGAPAGATAGASTPLWDCLPGSSVRHDMEPMPDLKEEEEEDERGEGEQQAVQVPRGGEAAATQATPLLLPSSAGILEAPQPASLCTGQPHPSLASAEAPPGSNPVFDSDSHILDQLHHIQAESPRTSSRFRSLTPCSSSLGPRPPPQQSGSIALLPRSAPRDPQCRASTTLVEAGLYFSPLASSCGASTPAEPAGLAQVGSAPTGYLMKAQPRHAPVRPSGKYAAAGVAGAKTAFGSPSIAPLLPVLPVSRLLAPPPASPTPAPDPSFDAISTRNPGSPHPGTQTPGPGQAPRPQPRPGPLEGTVTPLPPTQTAESELGPPPAPGSPLASTPPLTSSPNTSCPMTRRGLPKSREGYK